jgi:hypothetical protein
VLGLFILVAFRVASIATFALFQLLLPVLFTLLGMPERRRRMIEVGHQGQAGLRRAGEHVRHQFLGGPEPAGSSASGSGARARVAAQTPPTTIEHELAEAEAEIEAELAAQRARR